MRQDFAGEIWFVGPPFRPKKKILAKSLARLHRNLGHPRQEDFTRALSMNPKMEAEAVTLSRRMKCATCERTRRPLPPRPTSLKMIGPFNSDFVHVHDAAGDGHLFLHILEPNASYNVFYPVKSRKPEHVYEVLCDCWASWAGFPITSWRTSTAPLRVF